MNLFTQLLRDEYGFVLSAEMALLGTVGVIGATVGLSAVARSVNEELTDVAMAFRSLDQSYCFEGRSGCGSYTAGSSFRQVPVERSLRELREEVERAKAREKALPEQAAQDRDKAPEKDRDGQPPQMKKPGEKQPGDPNPKQRKKNRERAEDETSV